jgi:hypothetical protein
VSWNVDRPYAAGAQIRQCGHAGLMHEKLTLLRGQRMAIFGSSNWTSTSASSQHEHNIFTPTRGSTAGCPITSTASGTTAGRRPRRCRLPRWPPDVPILHAPANAAQEQQLAVTLRWWGGLWAHRYDVFLGTDPTRLTKVVDDTVLGPSTNLRDYVTWSVSGLRGGTTYYWQVTGRTMAGQTKTSEIFSFRTQGGAPPTSSNDVMLHA